MLENIISKSKYVVENAEYVKINYEKVSAIINEIKGFECQHYLTKSPFGIMQLDTENIIDFLLIYDSIDFSFWGNPKWKINVDGNDLDGGAALLYSILKIFKENKTASYDYLSRMSKCDFRDILKGNVEIPLFDERYNIVTSTAKKVVSEMNGSFYNSVIDIKTDTKLFDFIINNFPNFKDERIYNNESIPFYKLAQLLTSDILHILEYRENKKTDYSHLVGCADYKIPQVMRTYGILEYSAELANLVDNKMIILENSKFEIEIRASMIVVIDYIYNKLNKAIEHIDINDYIWGKGREKGLELKPYHLTRTTSY